MIHLAANAFAKLSKCQQFTTLLLLSYYCFQLQTLLQSYQNVSNSQPGSINLPSSLSCKRFCKVIKMLAIHNVEGDYYAPNRVANAFAKLSKCQQFTTCIYQMLMLHLLQTLLQSYQNVSNSQLIDNWHIKYLCCKRFCKVIKMLAIHNEYLSFNFAARVANAFAKLSKCQQFTTVSIFGISCLKLQTLLQSYQNVSNSQQYAVNIHVNQSCKRFCKVIKMLAIHNI